MISYIIIEHKIIEIMKELTCNKIKPGSYMIHYKSEELLIYKKDKSLWLAKKGNEVILAAYSKHWCIDNAISYIDINEK